MGDQCLESVLVVEADSNISLSAPQKEIQLLYHGSKSCLHIFYNELMKSILNREFLIYNGFGNTNAMYFRL